MVERAVGSHACIYACPVFVDSRSAAKQMFFILIGFMSRVCMAVCTVVRRAPMGWKSFPSSVACPVVGFYAGSLTQAITFTHLASCIVPVPKSICSNESISASIPAVSDANVPAVAKYVRNAMTQKHPSMLVGVASSGGSMSWRVALFECTISV